MKKNILLVEDSALMRRVIGDIINSDSNYQVSDICRNGKEAYELLKSGKKYDAMLLDIVMPVMTGIELLKKLNEERIRVAPTIVVSTLTAEGSSTVDELKALKIDNLEFLLKPSNFIEAKGGNFKNALLEILHSMIGPKLERTLEPPIRPRRNVSVERKMSQSSGLKKLYLGQSAKKKLVAIACSTGGPKALDSVIPKFSAKLDAPVLIVQHMPAGFTGIMAKKLDDKSRIKVKEAEDGELMQKGCVYIAPGGIHLGVKKSPGGNRIALLDDPARGGLKPCADIMYETLRGTDYDEITCVVLTGMGADGTKGITALGKTNNIYVVAQNEPTCVVYGMPRAIYEAGAVDDVEPLENIAGSVQKNVGVR